MPGRMAVSKASDSRAGGPGFATRPGNILTFLVLLVQEEQLSVTKVCAQSLVNFLGGLSLPRKNVLWLS